MPNYWTLLYPARLFIRVLRGLNRLCTEVYLKTILKRCGTKVSITRPFVIFGPKQVEIGNNVSISAFFQIHGMGNVRIGSRVMIASHVAITSLTHDHSSPLMYGTGIMRSVVIEDDVWIGTHAVILPGVTIGHGAVVGAGSVVTHDVPANAIVAGVPARIIQRNRLTNSIRVNEKNASEHAMNAGGINRYEPDRDLLDHSQGTPPDCGDTR